MPSRLPAVLIVALCLGSTILATPVCAKQLKSFLPQIDVQQLVPGAQTKGELQGNPAIVPVFSNGKQAGLIFLNSDFSSSTGYSGKPIDILVGMNMEGKITGLKLVEHHEPIVLIGIPESKILNLMDEFIGKDIVKLVRGEKISTDVDIISGATVTIMVINDSVLRASTKVARLYGLGGLKPTLTTKVKDRKVEILADSGETKSWQDLLGDGSVRSLTLSVKDINLAFKDSPNPEAASVPNSGSPDDLFIDLKAALVSIPVVGRNLLGDREYANLQNRLKDNQQALLLMGNGDYSFRGSGFVRGGLFDRFQLIQNESAIRFRDKQYKRLSRVAAADAPRFREIALLRIPENVKFDPTEPWRIQLLVGREIGPRDKAFLTFDLDYRLPSDYFRIEETKPALAVSQDNSLQASANSENSSSILDTPLWKRLWKQKSVEVVILIIALVILTAIFFFQDWLVQRPQLTDRVRLGFLIFTLFGIGFYANAQLSLVNVLTFFNSLLSGFSWNYFLREPLIFLLWFGVAASLIYWGRGAFCGWLCPFGALQELVNRIAKYFRVPQFAIPWSIHERLWPLKYMIFMIIFGISLNSLALAETLAEVEPFKTVIILKFARDWPFVVFAVALIAAGLFIERFYCRYLCPLGAALAIPGKIRLFDWLKRYKHCGSPCQLCAGECMVQAIHPEGQINPNECLYCLHCQTVYHNQHRCPVVIQRRLRQKSRDSTDLGIQNTTGKVGSSTSNKNNNTLQGINFNRSKSNEKIG